jgi:hypothetical protein
LPKFVLGSNLSLNRANQPADLGQEPRKREWDVNEIPLREGTVAAAKSGEENQRFEEILLSDWTLAAVKQREEERRRKEQVEPTLVPLKPKEEEEWTAIESLVSDWNLAFRQKQEERRKKEQAGEAAVVTMKRDEIAEAKILHQQAEAARRAKGEWRKREEAESGLRNLEGRQSERKETRAVAKSGIVRSRGAARMIGGVLSTLTTIAIASAIGFGAGVYITPPDKADEFRALVDSKLDEINGLMNRERAAIEPKAKAPSAPKEIQSAVPAEPAAEAPAAEATGQKDMPDANAPPPSATPTESSNSQSAAPVPSAEPTAPAMGETPSSAEEAPQAKPVAKKAPVAKPHPKPPVKKAKPKPKPAQHHPQAEPAKQAPAAEEPAQQ